MARPELVDDGFCELVKPLLGDHTPQHTQGAPESVTGQSVHGDRVRAGEWGTLADGLSADRLCYGVSTWWRLREWQRKGVWERVHRELLRCLNAAGRIDRSRGVVDSSYIRALREGPDRAFAG